MYPTKLIYMDSEAKETPKPKQELNWMFYLALQPDNIRFG